MQLVVTRSPDSPAPSEIDPFSEIVSIQETTSLISDDVVAAEEQFISQPTATTSDDDDDDDDEDEATQTVNYCKQ